jgi:hypothetical protein
VARVVCALALATVLLLSACAELGGFEQHELDATLDCSDGACQCAASFSNCDGDLTDGCENTATDINNCGSCGSTCGGECKEGRCAPLLVVPSAEYIGRYVINDTHLIAATCEGLHKLALDGGTLDTIDPDTPCKTHVVADGSDVFFGGETFVKRSAASGGQPEVLASEQSLVFDLVVAEHVYWVDIDVPQNNAVIRRSNRDGSMVETVVEHGPDFTGRLLVHEGQLYWSTEYPGGIHTLDPRNPGKVLNVFMDARMTPPFSLDSTHIYWAPWEGGLHRRPLDGGATVELTAVPTFVLSIATDDTHVYWTDLNAGTVSRMPLEGGDVELVADRQSESINLEIVGDWVYWSSLNEMAYSRPLFCARVRYGGAHQCAGTGGQSREHQE